MSNDATPSDISLSWLYGQIQTRHREAQLNAHRNFMAARLIQKVYRGYRVRSAIKICARNAIVLQRYYRGYVARKKYYDLLEQCVQQQFERHYHESATLIQKWFRGYYSRKYRLDFYKSREAQRKAARELILCVAYKLHHLLRTQQIPGVYSVRNSQALSKVEELMASLRFNEYNGKARKPSKSDIQKSNIVNGKLSKRKSIVAKKVPCSSKGNEITSKLSSKKLQHKFKGLMDTPRDAPQASVTVLTKDKGLYAKVISSMERCNIVQSDNISLCSDATKSPEKIEQFCCEMTDICRTQKL